MIDIAQFRTLIVRPVLEQMRMHSPAAENLLLGTALHESGLRYLHQIGGGPALGIFQIEPATHFSVWADYLAFHPDHAANVRWWLAGGPERDEQLVWNLAYATAIARLIYFRRPEPLPESTDVAGLAHYYKLHFNSMAGKAKEEDFINTYRKHLLP